jgi:hypothetical protein
MLPVAQEPSLHEKLMAIVHSPEYKAEQAERRKLQDACGHEGYSFAKHGRCCFKCGAFMVDFGD